MRPLPLDHPVRVTEDATPDARGIFPGLGDGGPPPVPLSTVLSPLRGSDRAGARAALEAPTRETLADLRGAYRDAGLAGPKLAAAMQSAARYIAHMRRRNPRGRTEPDHLRKAAYYAGAEALAAKVAREVEIPGFIGRVVWMAQARDLRKGAGHKYLRRVKGANGKWRYFYKVSGGRGLGHADEFHVGAKFAGGGGHFEIVSESGDIVEIRHDETGGTRRLDKAALSELLRKHHVEIDTEGFSYYVGRLGPADAYPGTAGAAAAARFHGLDYHEHGAPDVHPRRRGRGQVAAADGLLAKAKGAA